MACRPVSAKPFWTNAGILLIRTSGTNFSEILSKIHISSFKENAFENVVCEMPAILPRPQCVDKFQAKMKVEFINQFFHADQQSLL